jgi:SEC-C motif
MLPPVLQELLMGLEQRGYARITPDAAEDLAKDQGPIFILQHGDEVPADKLALACLGADEWVVVFGFGNAFWPMGDVMRALKGETLHNQPDLPALEVQVNTALRVVDLLRTDRAARTHLTALLAPEPDDPALEGCGNDPCWCGSGKKLKRCHRALSPH